MPRKAILILLLLTFAAALMIAPVAAQDDFPNRPVQFVVPWPPGDLEDVLTRLIADELQSQTGVPAAVVNVPGGGGVVGATEVFTAEPDGHTIGSFVIGIPTVQVQNGNAPYDREEFEPIGIFLTYPFVIAAAGDAPFSNDGDVWIEQLMAFVRDLHTAQVPLVGICFGHQLIASALGGIVQRAPDGWMAGLYAFEFLTDLNDTIATEDPTPVRLYHLNQDQVIQLPNDAVHIGTSEQCPNSMYRIGDHILSIQGHPELLLDTLRGYLVTLADELTAPVIQRAEQSVATTQPDAIRVAHWIKNFFEMERNTS